MRRMGGWTDRRMNSKGHAVRRCRVAFQLLGIFAVVASAHPPIRLSAQTSIHAQAIPLVTRAWHLPGSDATKTEFALVQPAVMLEWRSPSTQHPAPAPRFSLHVTLDGEGLTIPDGELAPGDYGEGFYDRRHPHTYFHEIMGTAQDLLGAHDGRLELSVAAGKGFVAFGDDDPMSRPVVRYPVDHHLAQLLERAVVIGSASFGPARIEATWFNGDEPAHPSSWPNWDRAFDSHAFRFTLLPKDGIEAQYSYAKVQSPEDRGGGGLAQAKHDVTLRWAGNWQGRASYALLNWARTTEGGGFFAYSGVVAEGSTVLGRHHPYLRFERTDRPEDQRTADPFRSVRPHLDNASLGTTRWTVVTAGNGVSFLTAGGRLEWRPFVEVSVARVRAVDGIFDPKAFYGSDVLPSMTFGVRLDWGGMGGMRMGHYFDAAGRPAMPGMEM